MEKKHTEKVIAMEEGIVFEASTYIKKYGRRRLERPENASDRYAVAAKKEENIGSKGIAGGFAVFAMGRYYRMYSNRAQEIFS